LEIAVLVFWFFHSYNEFVQLRSAATYLDHFSSAFNILDAVIVVAGPIIFVLQCISIVSSFQVDWADHDNYINVEQLYWCTQLQTQFYSIMTFCACLKLFDYLAVFRELNRLMVMIEMMAGQLKSFMIILGLFMLAFTVSEYIAYGYKDEQSYSVGKGFIARVYGLFAGDPVTFGHTDSDEAVGTFYVMAFLIIVPMLLMNLLVAMLTSAYDEARNQSSDVLAERQYDSMEKVGLCTRKTVTVKVDGKDVTITRTAHDDHQTFLDDIDRWMLRTVLKYWAQFQMFLDQRASQVYEVRKKQHEQRALANQDAVYIIPDDKVPKLRSPGGRMSIVQIKGAMSGEAKSP